MLEVASEYANSITNEPSLSTSLTVKDCEEVANELATFFQTFPFQF